MFGLEDSLLQDMMLADTSPNPDRGLIPVARPHWGTSARSRSINFNQVCFISNLKYFLVFILNRLISGLALYYIHFSTNIKKRLKPIF